MRLNLILLLLAAAILSILGTFLIRYGGKNLDFSKGLWHICRHGYLWFLGIFICWIAGLSFSLLLTKFEITTVISFYIPFVYLFLNLGGIFLFNEAISISKLIGMCFILIGLCFLLLTPQ